MSGDGARATRTQGAQAGRPPGAQAGRPRGARARVLLAAVVAAVLLAAGCAPGGASGDPGSVNGGYVAGDGSFATWPEADRGDPVELTGTSYEGDQIDVADWRGDVTVLNFWYAACPPCRAEAPDLAAVQHNYAAQGVHLLGINPRDDVGTAQAFERTFDMPYPSLHDSGARGVAALEGLVPLQAMPSTVVLDRDGRVAARVLGQADPTILRGLIDDVLAEGA
ncbi:TlpA disulfide reductase family protein [Georgenia sp. SYP-B2076]|uniref:TlpA family protein disulfide reductase n=1 Tax=Georgenia sp. SYP-B2076 TaxID=2495881 RepID=UPI001F0C3F8E|nr:TlpA disulfide reductase family protein [Georgenia sp. SYP-B2076]